MASCAIRDNGIIGINFLETEVYPHRVGEQWTRPFLPRKEPCKYSQPFF